MVVREAPKEEPELPDEVRLGEEGWKERYYNHKFKVSASDESFKKQYVLSSSPSSTCTNRSVQALQRLH